MSKVKETFKNILNPYIGKISNPPVNLNLRMGLDWLLCEAHSLAECKNIVWLSKKEFEALKSASTGQDYFSSLTYFEDIAMVKKFPIENSDLIQIVAPLDGERITTTSVGNTVLAPLCHPEDHHILGYIIAIGVAEKNIKKNIQALSTLTSVAARYISYCVQYFEATALTLKDDLTSLYNQKYLSMVLDNEISRSQRENLNFSVLFIDIDHFKKVNDNKGHWVGSHLIAELGGLLGASVRKSDYAFRYGGDEFVVVLPHSDSESAKIVAERIRSTVEEKAFYVDGEEIQVTLSIGIATFPDHAKSRQEIIKMADEAMYNGKNKSRNIVLMAG